MTKLGRCIRITPIILPHIIRENRQPQPDITFASLRSIFELGIKDQSPSFVSEFTHFVEQFPSTGRDTTYTHAGGVEEMFVVFDVGEESFQVCFDTEESDKDGHCVLHGLLVTDSKTVDYASADEMVREYIVDDIRLSWAGINQHLFSHA